MVAEAGLRFFPVMSGLHALPVSKDSPVFRFNPNRDFVFSRDWNFDMTNRGHVNNDGWVNNQDYRVSEYPPLVAVIGDSQVEAVMMPYPQTFHGYWQHYLKVSFDSIASERQAPPLANIWSGLGTRWVSSRRERLSSM
jgi:hypothetical protein